MDKEAGDVTAREPALRRGDPVDSRIARPGSGPKFGDGAGSELEPLRTNIRETEARLVETIHAIQKKLSIDNIGRQVGDRLEAAAIRGINIMENAFKENNGHSTMETLKHSSGPAALLGLGIGWLILQNMKHQPEEESQQSRTSQAADLREPTSFGQVGKAVEQSVERGKEASVEVMKHYREKAKEMREKAADQVRSARGRFSEIVEDRPFAVGLAGLAAGVIVGIVTANALHNSEFLSETRENLKKKTREFVEGTREKAGKIAHQVSKAAREEAERQHIITH